MLPKKKVEKTEEPLDGYGIYSSYYINFNPKKKIITFTKKHSVIGKKRVFQIKDGKFFDVKFNEFDDGSEWLDALNMKKRIDAGRWKSAPYKKINPNSTCEGKLVVSFNDYKDLTNPNKNLKYGHICRIYKGLDDDGKKIWKYNQDVLYTIFYDDDGLFEINIKGTRKGKGIDHTIRNEDIVNFMIRHEVGIEFIMVHTDLKKSTINKILQDYRHKDITKEMEKNPDSIKYFSRDKEKIPVTIESDAKPKRPHMRFRIPQLKCCIDGKKYGGCNGINTVFYCVYSDVCLFQLKHGIGTQKQLKKKEI